LVEPRRLAKLHVFSGNMQMFLEVVPLEKGALHDLVRVKLPGSGQILRGRVVAPGQLEAQF
jgi:flagella basal body P-ring formation protein FlgA